MAIEGLARDIAELEGQRSALPGNVFSGASKIIGGRYKAFGEDVKKAEWQKQLSLGKEGVLKMADELEIDENQRQTLNIIMQDINGTNAEGCN
jgi:hypothetical protein